MRILWSIIWRAVVLFYPMWLGLAALVGFVFVPDEKQFDVATFTGFAALALSPILAGAWVRHSRRG